MKRLLKRRLVQQSLESAEKEMGGKTLTLDELDKLLKEQGITTNVQNYTYRIAADNTTRLIYISGMLTFCIIYVKPFLFYLYPYLQTLYVADKNAYLKGNNVDSNSENAQNNESKVNEATAGSSKAVSIYDDINEYELNDDWDSDIEVMSTDDFRFTEVNSDTQSETESNESRALSKKYFGKSATNPALTYMLEYSGLTEKQILTLLEQNNSETNKIGKDVAKVPQQVTFLETQHCEDKNNLSDEQHLIPVLENDKEYTKPDCTNVKSIHVSEMHDEIVECKATNSESDVETDIINISPVEIACISNKTKDELENVPAISSTDSDSDDFIEIEDTPISEVTATVNKCIPQQGIQITFKSDEKMENDMFADIFEKSNSELNAEIYSQDTPVFDKLSRQSPKSPFCESEIQRNEITFVKPVVAQSLKDQVKDKQLSNVEKLNDGNAQSLVDIDASILNTNVQSEEDEIKEKAATENVMIFPKDNVEVANIKDNTNINTTIDRSRKVSPIPTNEDELLSLQVRKSRINRAYTHIYGIVL